MFPTTKTDIAKAAVSMLLSMKVKEATVNVVGNNTELDPDSATVQISGYVAGALVAYKARPHTDKLVDTVISKFQVWQSNKNIAK